MLLLSPRLPGYAVSRLNGSHTHILLWACPSIIIIDNIEKANDKKISTITYRLHLEVLHRIVEDLRRLRHGGDAPDGAYAPYSGPQRPRELHAAHAGASCCVRPLVVVLTSGRERKKLSICFQTRITWRSKRKKEIESVFPDRYYLEVFKRSVNR